MKTLKIILAIFLIGISGLTLFNYNRLKFCCDHHNTCDYSSNLSEAVKNKSIIAIYRHLTKVDQPILFVERILVRETAKYVFFEPHYYSKDYYATKLPKNVLIYSDNDNSFSSGFTPLNNLPDSLKIKDASTKLSDYYVIDTIFQENIDKVPTVSFLSQFSLIQKCND